MYRFFAVLALTIAVSSHHQAKAEDIPTIRVGWTIPAEEAKYWMMRRPQEFPDLGKTYKIEWSQFQGTSVMSQALIAGALESQSRKAPQPEASRSIYSPNMPARRPAGSRFTGRSRTRARSRTVADLKGKTVGIIIGGGTQGPFNLLLKKNGVDPEKDIKLVEVSFPLSEEAIRSGRVEASNMVQPFAAQKPRVPSQAALNEVLPDIVHIVEACRKDFVDKNPKLAAA